MTCPFFKHRVLPLLVFLFIAIALGVGFSTWPLRRSSDVPKATATQVHQAQKLPIFFLRDETNHLFTNRSLQNHYSLLLFCHTHSPNTRSDTITLLSRVYAQIKKEDLPPPQIVFISLYPHQDSRDQFAQYIHHFNPAFRGITGPSANIQQLRRQMGVIYIKAYTSQKRLENNQNDSVNPSRALYLIDPTGKLLMVFSPPYEKDIIVRSYRSLVKTR